MRAYVTAQLAGVRDKRPTRMLTTTTRNLIQSNLARTLTWFLLASTFKTSTSDVTGDKTEDIKPQIQLFSGAYFLPMPEIIPYHSSIPLLYNIPINLEVTLTDNNKQFTCAERDKMSSSCEVLRRLEALKTFLHQQIDAELLPFQPVTKKSRKQKRSLAFIGEAFQWCCGLATEAKVANLVDNEQDITEHTNSLIDMISIDHRDLVKNTENLNNFTNDVLTMKNHFMNNFKMLENKVLNLSRIDVNQTTQLIHKLTLQSWTYQYLNYFYDNLRYTNQQCNLNQLPMSLITKQTLTSDLLYLKKSTNVKNLTLAISWENIDAYYKLPLTTCLFTPKGISISLKVPLKLHKLKYSVYKSIPTPLHWKNTLCYISKEETLIVKTNDFTKILGEQEEGCNSRTFPLCFLQRTSMNTRLDTMCFHYIMQGANITVLKSHCEFSCHNLPQLPVVTQILPNKFLITNIKNNVTLSCFKNQSKSFQIPKTTAGTYEVNLPCDCAVYHNNFEIISTLSPCDSSDHFSYKLTHFQPMAWTKFHSLKLFPLESNLKHEFNHLNEILDNNWTSSSPTYFVHNRLKSDVLDHIKLKHNQEDIFNNTQLMIYILLAWLTLLSILLMGALCCIYINKLKIKLILPHPKPRDYQTEGRSS